jgi:hypothetical protein
MADLEPIRNAVQTVVSDRLKDHVPHFRQELADQIFRQIEPLLAHVTATSGAISVASETLNASISAIQESFTQAEILKSLLDGAAQFTARAALFVIRGNNLAGWQARGFADESVRGLNLDASQGLAARAIGSKARAAAAASDFDAAFIAHHGTPWDGNATLFPLVVKDKVAAILYCDAGQDPDSRPDMAAVEVLTRYSCLWLEQTAGRKASPAADVNATESVQEAVAPAPIAAPAVAHAAPPAAGTEESLAQLPSEEQDLHRKAKRFAKLLVDEIKLYNQSKVAEGRQAREIYKVLREDIEKSRATYNKRYGNTLVASANYFSDEIVRILADNDRALLGTEFPG